MGGGAGKRVALGGFEAAGGACPPQEPGAYIGFSTDWRS